MPADAVLVDCVNFSVDESALTGESVPVRKAASRRLGRGRMGRPGGDATPWVFSGTLVVKGHGIALVKETGAGTELGRIGTALRTIEPERTPLQREIDRLVRVVAVIGVAAAAVVIVAFGLTRGHWLEGLLAGIATAMAMLPEEFPVVLTVFLALGAWRMSQRHVLTRRSPVIETLGSATVICVDKTGTLTMNSMTVRELVVDGSVHVLDDRPLPERFHEIAEFAVLASPIDPFDPMDRAFKDLGDAYLTGHRAPAPRLGAGAGVPAVGAPAGALARVALTGPQPTTSSPPRARRRRSLTCATSTPTNVKWSSDRSNRPHWGGCASSRSLAPVSARRTRSLSGSTTSISSSSALPDCTTRCDPVSPTPSPSARVPGCAS